MTKNAQAPMSKENQALLYGSDFAHGMKQVPGFCFLLAVLKGAPVLVLLALVVRRLLLFFYLQSLEEPVSL